MLAHWPSTPNPLHSGSPPLCFCFLMSLLRASNAGGPAAAAAVAAAQDEALHVEQVLIRFGVM